MIKNTLLMVLGIFTMMGCNPEYAIVGEIGKEYIFIEVPEDDVAVAINQSRQCGQRVRNAPSDPFCRFQVQLEGSSTLRTAALRRAFWFAPLLR